MDHRTTNPLWRAWPESRVVIIGGGPSVTPKDIELVRLYRDRVKVIGINDAYRICDFLDVLYAADWDWWEHHAAKTAQQPLRVTCDEEAAKKHGLLWMPGTEGDSISVRPGLIHYGQNSGFQALNIAIQAGAREVLLLGYDMQPNANGEQHWFGEHPGILYKKMPFGIFLRSFQRAAQQIRDMGVTVLNCSLTSAMVCFQKMRLSEALCADSTDLPE